MDLCSRSVEFRANASAGDGDGRTLEGYAAVFDQDTEINSWEGRFTERIAKGAFKK
ncbi:HK97 family phage prohead protease, partial [Rhodococcus hoagii]|nr:HK97 family phage prohead protease [Prescottella equi]